MARSLEAYREQSDFLAVPADAKTKRRIADIKVGTMTIVRRRSVVPYVDVDSRGRDRHGIAVRTNDEIPKHAEELKHPVGLYNAEINLGDRAITGFVIDGRRGNLFTESRLRRAKTLGELEREDPVAPLIVSYKDNDGEIQETVNALDKEPYMEQLSELEEWLDEFYGGELPKTDIDQREEERGRDVGRFIQKYGGKLLKYGVPIAVSIAAPEAGAAALIPVAQEFGPQVYKTIAQYIKK